MRAIELLPPAKPVFARAWASHLRRCGGLSYVAGVGRVNGSGAGRPLHAARAGAGEYLERLALFTGIHPDSMHSVAELGCIGEALGEMLEQMAPAQELDGHRFLCSGCSNRSDSKVAYPTVLLSLARRGFEEDARLVPYIDSCGSALHATQEQALQGASCEFLERQMLVATWLGKQASQLTLDIPRLDTTAASHAKAMQGCGELRVFTSESPVGGHFCLAIYRGTARIKFSVGASFCLDPYSALHKSIVECWHGVMYLSSVLCRPGTAGAVDLLKSGFIDGNVASTASRFPCWASARYVPMESYLCAPSISLATVLHRWDLLSSTRIVYARRFGMHWLCRVADPAFYAHMNPGLPLNFRNSFAEAAGVVNPPASQRTQIPFP